MSEKIRRFLLFNGLKELDFKVIQQIVAEENQKVELVAYIFMTLFLCVLLGISWLFNVNTEAQSIYIISAAITPAIMVVAESLKLDFPNTSLGQQIVIFIAFTCGVCDVVVNPSRLAIAPVVLLFTLPIIFVNRPIVTIVRFLFYLAVFVVACMYFKASNVYIIDIISAIVAYIFGIIAACLIHNRQCFKWLHNR